MTPEDRLELYKHDKNICYECGRTYHQCICEELQQADEQLGEVKLDEVVDESLDDFLKKYG